MISSLETKMGLLNSPSESSLSFQLLREGKHQVEAFISKRAKFHPLYAHIYQETSTGHEEIAIGCTMESLNGCQFHQVLEWDAQGSSGVLISCDIQGVDVALMDVVQNGTQLMVELKTQMILWLSDSVKCGFYI